MIKTQDKMMSTQEEDDTTTFTLSFGGVEFCLTPSCPTEADEATASDVMSISKVCNGEVCINLNQFVGTLLIRVKNHRSDAPASTTEQLQATSESVTENNDDDNEETVDNMSVDDGALTPNPVEDTPSPKAKSEGEDEDKPAMDKLKQQKGQQKLNFFGRHGKNQGGDETQKPNAPTSKRNPANDELESTNRKKSRRSSTKSEEKKSSLEICIEEPKINASDNKSSNNINNGFTMQSLGQSMPSQEDSRDAFDVSPTKKEAAGKKSSIPATTSPCPRWGQTMTMIDHKRFIVYGGQTIDKDDTAKPLSDLFVYDLMEGKWTKPMNCDGVARTWHSANFLPERQLLLCFGGEKLDVKNDKLVTTDEVMVLDTEIMLWYPPSVSGQKPSGRGGHASCVLPKTNELVVFGGVKNGKWLNSVSILDTNRWKWSTLKAVGDSPRPRSYHSATAIGSKVVIFGGNDGETCFNGVHVLESTGEGKKWVWSNPKCKGDAPSPRTGHTATLLNDGSTIMIYGGWDPNTREDENGDDLIFEDSFILDTKTWIWSKGTKARYEKSKNNASNGGAQRVGHSSVLAPGGKNGVQVLSFGGRVPENQFAGDFQTLLVPL